MSAIRSILVTGALLVALVPVQAAQKQGASVQPMTPLAQKIFCLRNPEECRVHEAGKNVDVAGGRVVLSAERMAELNRVNTSVNAKIRPRAEKGADRWQLGAASGDCEDYVLAKQRMLNGMGWPTSATLITKVRTKKGELHAVLVARTNGGDFVLDNLSGSVKPAKSVSYSWVSMQTPADPMKWQKASGKI